MEDKLLIVRCRQGCAKSLTRIYEKYSRDMLFLAAALLNETAAAEDVVHDVFISFVEGIPSFRLTGSLKGFLLTCVANQSRNFNKRKRTPPPETQQRLEDTHTTPSTLDRIVSNEQLDGLSNALAQLPADQRETIMLHLYGGISLRALARTRGQSANTVKSRYRYGVENLRQLLNGEVKS